MGTTATRLTSVTSKGGELRSVTNSGGEVEPMAEGPADPETLEDRIEVLEEEGRLLKAQLAVLEQKFNYLQARNHGLESAVAASAALLASVTVPTMAFGSAESEQESS